MKKCTMRMLSLFLAGMFVLSILLMGCNGNKTNNVPADATTGGSAAVQTNGTEVTQVQLEPVELSLYFLTWSGQQKDQELVEAEMDKYLKDKINAKVKLYGLDWDTFITKTNAMSAANEAYDICFTSSWCEFLTGAARNRWLDMNQDGLLDKYGAGIKERLDEVFMKGGQYFDSYSGKYIQYALPVYKEKAHSTGLVFNKKLVDKYGMDISKINTNEDLLPLFKIIKENEKDVIPLGIVAGDSFGFGNKWVELERIAGDNVPGDLYADSDDTTVFNRYEKPEYKETCDFVRKCFLEGYISPDAAAKTNTVSQKSNEGLVFCGPIGLKPGKDAEMSNDKVTFIQKEMLGAYSASTDLNGSMQAISRTSENPERAMMLLNLLYTDRTFLNLFVYGIENKHYTKVSDNVIKTVVDSGYSFGVNWMFGDQTLNFLTDKEDPDKWAKFEEFNKSAKPYKSLGFQFNLEPWKAQYAAIKTIMTQYAEPLNCGAVDPNEYLPKFLKKMKDAGVDQYLEALQKEFNEWYAKNKQ